METRKFCIFEAFRKGHIDTIVHCANQQKTMGAGIALEIAKRFPEAAFADMAHTGPLGYSLAYIDDTRGTGTIVNLYGQEFYGNLNDFYHKYHRNLDYNLLIKGLTEINQIHSNRRIGIPFHMGCNRAGGDWEIVKGILNATLSNNTFVIYDPTPVNEQTTKWCRECGSSKMSEISSQQEKICTTCYTPTTWVRDPNQPPRVPNNRITRK